MGHKHKKKHKKHKHKSKKKKKSSSDESIESEEEDEDYNPYKMEDDDDDDSSGSDSVRKSKKHKKKKKKKKKKKHKKNRSSPEDDSYSSELPVEDSLDSVELVGRLYKMSNAKPSYTKGPPGAADWLVKLHPCLFFKACCKCCSFRRYCFVVAFIEIVFISIPVLGYTWSTEYFELGHQIFQWDTRFVDKIPQAVQDHVDRFVSAYQLIYAIFGVLFLCGGIMLFQSICMRSKVGCFVHTFCMVICIGCKWAASVILYYIFPVKIAALEPFQNLSEFIPEEIKELNMIHHDANLISIVTSVCVTPVCLWFAFCSVILGLQIIKKVDVEDDTNNNTTTRIYPNKPGEVDTAPGESILISSPSQRVVANGPGGPKKVTSVDPFARPPSKTINSN